MPHVEPAITLKEILGQLDYENEDHWTADGLPRMDTIHILSGDQDVTRAQVIEAWPTLTRETAERAAAESAPMIPPIPAAAPAPPEPLPTPAAEIMPSPDDVDLEEVVDVLTLPRNVVLQSPKYTAAALEAMNARCNDAVRRRKEINEELEQLHVKCEILKRAEIQHMRNGHRPKSNAIKDYLEGQRKAREIKAARAMRFIDANTSPAAVAQQLASKSPIDVAMERRDKRPSR